MGPSKGSWASGLPVVADEERSGACEWDSLVYCLAEKRTGPPVPRPHPDHSMTSRTPNLNWIANDIWGVADDVLREVCVRGKYRDVILPMTVLRRLDAVLEPTKQAVLDMKDSLYAIGVVDQKAALRDAAGQAFYNTSKFTLKDLRARASRSQLKATSRTTSTASHQASRTSSTASKADALGSLTEKLTSPEVNLRPDPVMDTDGTVRHPGLDNHAMSTVFEELIRRFNEENNKEAGEHFTPRDAVMLIATLVSKMKQKTRLGCRTAEVHNGSSLFTGSAVQGESNSRNRIIENDWLGRSLPCRSRCRMKG